MAGVFELHNIAGATGWIVRNATTRETLRIFGVGMRPVQLEVAALVLNAVNAGVSF